MGVTDIGPPRVPRVRHPLGDESLVTLPTLSTQVPDRVLVPHGGTRPGRSLPIPDKRSASETDSRGTSGPVDYLLYVHVTVIILSRGGSGSLHRPLPQ